MNGLKRRIDRLEKAAMPRKEKPIRICIQDYDQTSEQAMKAAGIEPDDDALTVFVIKWCTGKEHEGDVNHQEPTGNIDRQIEQLKRDLLAEGMTAQELAEIEAKYHDTKNG